MNKHLPKANKRYYEMSTNIKKVVELLNFSRQYHEDKNQIDS